MKDKQELKNGYYWYIQNNGRETTVVEIVDNGVFFIGVPLGNPMEFVEEHGKFIKIEPPTDEYFPLEFEDQLDIIRFGPTFELPKPPFPEDRFCQEGKQKKENKNDNN